MTYDFIRLGTAAFLFIALSVVLSLITKKKAKSVFISAVSAALIFGALLLVPIENFFYSFDSVEKIYSYRHHEELVTYAECDEGVLCVARQTDGSSICYCFKKDKNGYKLPAFSTDNINSRSSRAGIFIIKDFNKQTLILTQVNNMKYDGADFVEIDYGYSYAVVENFIPSKLTRNGETVNLV